MPRVPGPRTRAFVDFYCTPDTPTFGNGQESALAAGCGGGSAKSAREAASRMLRRPKVQALIAERLAAAGITHATIRARVAGRFFSEGTTNADVARLGKLLAEMTPGALAPQKHEHAVGLTWEQLVPKKKPEGEGE